MKKTLFCFCGFLVSLFISITAHGQEKELLNFEKNLEQAIFDTNIPFLEKSLAEDLRVKHGNGVIDNKSSWLKSIEQAKGKYISRVADSVEVEIHGKIGITNGRLTISRKTDEGDKVFMIKYVRVYVKNDQQWQMIMHRTVFEKDY